MKEKLNLIKHDKKYIYLFLFLLLLNSLLTKYVSGNSNKSLLILITVLIFEVLIGLFYFLFFNKIKIKKIKIEKVYLIMIIPLGIMYMFLFPINTIPDESGHFFRAYEISSGHLTTKIKSGIVGRNFDTNLDKIYFSTNYNKIFKNINIHNSNKKQYFGFENTALYCFVCYLPQAIGIFIARLLGLSILLQAYFGRLFNFASFVLITYFAIKNIPIKKENLLLFLMIPLIIQEAMSLSPDSLTIALSFALVSFVLYMKSTKEKLMNKKEYIIMTLIAIFLSLCKIVYLPLCLLLFIIPKEKFGSLKKKNIFIILLAIFIIFINLLWLRIASKYLIGLAPGVNSSKQLNYIISNPTGYLSALLLTYSNEAIDYCFSIFGKSLGTYNINLFSIYIIVEVIISFLATLFNNNVKLKISNLEKYLIIFIILIVIILMSTSLYIQWTPLKNNTIYGIQGRYFLPLLMLVPILFDKIKLSPKIDFSNKYILIFVVSLNIYALASIFYSFI